MKNIKLFVLAVGLLGIRGVSAESAMGEFLNRWYFNKEDERVLAVKALLLAPLAIWAGGQGMHDAKEINKGIERVLKPEYKSTRDFYRKVMDKIVFVSLGIGTVFCGTVAYNKLNNGTWFTYTVGAR